MSDNKGSGEIRIDPRFLEQFQKSMELREFYIERYNELSEKYSGLFAFSTLSQSKTEIEKLAEEIRQEIVSTLKPIKEYLEDDFKPEKANKIKSKILTCLENDFPDAVYKQFITSNKELTEWFKKLSNLLEQPFIEDLAYDIHYAFSLRENLEEKLLHIKSLTDLSKSIFYGEYPKSFDDSISEKNTDQGRPYDSSAPQLPITEFIEDIIVRAKNKQKGYERFWHFTGSHKNTPNKNQIIQTISNTELVGELSADTIKDRVYKAVKILGY